MLRDCETFDAIRQDNLAYIMMVRNEKPLTDLPFDDTPEILLHQPTPIQVAAFYSAEKVFFYLLKQKGPQYTETRPNSKIETIHFACAGGNQKIVSALISEDISNLNKIDVLGNSPLHYAVKYRKTEIAKYLLTQKCEPDVKNNDGLTPEHIAAINGDIEIIKLLVENGCTFKTINNLGWCPLFYSIRCNQIECAKYLIENGLYDAEVETFISLTQEAIQFKHSEIMKLLLDKGIKANDTNHNTWGIAHFAASVGEAETVSYLYEKYGRELFTELDRLDRSIAHIAAINGHLNVIQAIDEIQKKENNPEFNMHGLADKYGKTPFLYACEFGSLDIIKYYVEGNSNFNINQQDKLGNNGLHLAVQKDQIEIAQYLIEKGIQINALDSIGRTALVLSCETSNLDLLNLLLDKGADPNIQPTNNRPIISSAVIGNNVELLKCLITRGADPTLIDSRGWSALHFAAQIGAIDILDLLIHDKRTIKLFESQNDLGQTPFMIAVFWNQVDTVRYLIESGLDFVGIADKKGNTALHLAARLNHFSIAELLLDSTQINVNQLNNDQQTALVVAVEAWSLEIVKLLLSRIDCRVNTPNAEGMTAFLIACKLGQLDTVTLFLESLRVKTDIVDAKGLNAANYAAELQSKDVLRAIAKSGRVDMTIENNGVTPAQILEEDGGLEVEEDVQDESQTPSPKKVHINQEAENAEEEILEEEEFEEDEYEDDQNGSPMFLNSGEVYLSRTKDNLLTEPAKQPEESAPQPSLLAPSDQ